MLKNLCYPIPTIGRISIGEIVDNGTRRLPKRLNHFRITAQHKRDGQWVQHPIAEAVAKKTNSELDKLTSIPVKVICNDPDLVVRERFEAYENNGRIVCAGNGEKAKRAVGDKFEEVPCPGADHCEFGKAARCDLMVRANFRIDVEADNVCQDELSTFILRSGGFNTARTLNRKLHFYAKLFGDKLVGVPFLLRLRMKSTAMSMNTPFFYVDLVTAVPLQEAAKLAKETAATMKELGLDQASLDAIVKEGIQNGPFEDSSEDFPEIEEFLLAPDDGAAPAAANQEGGHKGVAVPSNMDELRRALEESGQEKKAA